jgi:hypothetical protein
MSLDTLRYDAVSACPEKTHLRAYGLEDLPDTPNLDEFFGEALYFPTALSPIPLTTPAHASVFTGLYPGRHGARALFKWAVADGVTNLAEELGPKGYETVAVLQTPEEHFLNAGTGVLRGFEHVFADVFDACEHCAAAGRPVLLFIHTFDIHTPYCWSFDEDVRKHFAPRREAVEELAAEVGLEGRGDAEELESMEWNMGFYKRAWQAARERYRGEKAVALFLRWYCRGVNWFDRASWRRTRRALRECGLYDESLTVLFSDHGEAARPDAEGHPLLHIDTLLEDNLRVPVAFRGEGIEPGVRLGTGSLVDVAPTVMDWLGMEPVSLGRRGRLDGRSLLSQPEDDGRSYFAESWTRNATLSPARTGYAPSLEEFIEEVWTPAQGSITRGHTKLVWHPGPYRLERFWQRERGTPKRLGRRARRWLRNHLPGPVVRAVKACLATVRWVRRRLVATAGDPGERLRSWRQAPMFAFDLGEDPLEEKPVRLTADELAAPPYADLLDRLRSYWEEGVVGPQIKLDVDEDTDEEVLQRLRDLGYAE